ncbi:MAG: hypothetical protein H7Y22_06285 [Gemmatimonadaceae bacterium]|nr:hypothetical protein [Gloeobacterales cyanobacterium ES-bin-141]
MSEQPPTPRRRRGNPNFIKGNRLGVGLPAPIAEGEKTERVSTRLPTSLKAQFDALPGTASEKLRQAVEIYVQQAEAQ